MPLQPLGYDLEGQRSFLGLNNHLRLTRINCVVTYHRIRFGAPTMKTIAKRLFFITVIVAFTLLPNNDCYAPQ